MVPQKPLSNLQARRTPYQVCLVHQDQATASHRPMHASLLDGGAALDGGMRTQSIPYEELMQQLGIANIRELEDLLITDCFHQGIITGRLDQRQKRVEVLDSIGRDVPASELQPIIDSLQKWWVQCSRPPAPGCI